MASFIISILLAMPVSSAFAGVNLAPILGEITDKTEDENDSIIITIDATDPDGDMLTFSASGLPSFGEIVNTGENMADLIFETDHDSSGMYIITVTVTDEGGLSDSDTFTLNVLNDIDGDLAIIDEAIDEVAALADAGELNNGQSTSLIKILENSISKLENDQISSAMGMLEAFINKVNALILSGKLTSEDGYSLIEEIQELIDGL